MEFIDLVYHTPTRAATKGKEEDLSSSLKILTKSVIFIKISANGA